MVLGLALAAPRARSNDLTFERRVHREHLRQVEQPGDRDQVLLRIEAHVLEDERIDDHRLAVEDADRVAVGRRVGAGARADRARRAHPVLDHDGLAERRAHLLGERAHEHVAQAARALRGDRADRPVRVVVGERGRRWQHDGREQCTNAGEACHRGFLPGVVWRHASGKNDAGDRKRQARTDQPNGVRTT